MIRPEIENPQYLDHFGKKAIKKTGFIRIESHYHDKHMTETFTVPITSIIFIRSVYHPF